MNTDKKLIELTNELWSVIDKLRGERSRAGWLEAWLWMNPKVTATAKETGLERKPTKRRHRRGGGSLVGGGCSAGVGNSSEGVRERGVVGDGTGGGTVAGMEEGDKKKAAEG